MRPSTSQCAASSRPTPRPLSRRPRPTMNVLRRWLAGRSTPMDPPTVDHRSEPYEHLGIRRSRDLRCRHGRHVYMHVLERGLTAAGARRLSNSRQPPILITRGLAMWLCRIPGNRSSPEPVARPSLQVRVEQGVDPVGPGRAVPAPCETPPPRPEQYGAVPHIDSGILPRCPSIVRRHGIPPLCRPRHACVCR